MCLNCEITWTCPFDYIKHLPKIMEGHKVDRAGLAAMMGRSEAYVQELMDLDELPDYLKTRLKELLDQIHAPRIDFALEYARMYKFSSDPILVESEVAARAACRQMTRL